MARVLLLADDSLDFQGRRAIQSLSRDLKSAHQITARTLSGGDDAVSRNLRAVRTLRAERVDLVFACGLPALLTAAMAHAGPIVFSFAAFPSLRQLRWLRAVMDYRDVQVICPTSTMHRNCVERGVSIERCHLIRPGVEFGRINRRRDAKLRLALGLGESDHVLLLPGESTKSADHATAVWAVSILNVLDPKYRVLAWGRGDQVNKTVAVARQQNQPNLIAMAEPRLGRSIEFEELLPAADGVLISAGASVSTLPIAICMAAGLPIVSTVTYEVAELLEDRHTALMVTKRSARAIAQRIMDLRENKDIQWSIADMAKTEAFEYFAHSRFINQWRTVIGQVLAGEKVSVPQAAPGAGLRFHGLG